VEYASSLASGDLVIFTYYYGDNVLGLTTVTYYDNDNVIIGTGTAAGTVYKISPTAPDGVLTWVLTEV
jgi:hypothetical protein